MTGRMSPEDVVASMTGSETPTVEQAQAANSLARRIRQADDPAARVLDTLGREWARKNNGGWGAIGSDVSASSLAEIDANYGPTEVLA